MKKPDYVGSYIEKLSNGINPPTDQPIPDADLLNHVRISRCLFYVPDLLRQMIDRGGAAKPVPKTKKEPFYLKEEERYRFPFSQNPIPVSEIAKRFNELIDQETIKKLSYKHITDWLVEVEALVVIPNTNGKTSKRPTSKGLKPDISTKLRQGAAQEYVVVLYNQPA